MIEHPVPAFHIGSASCSYPRSLLFHNKESLAERFAVIKGHDGKTAANSFDQDIENLIATQQLVETELGPAASSVARADFVYITGDRDSLTRLKGEE